MTSRADQHDLDKLERWRRDLLATPASAFPACAIFLVSAEDRAAHDIFRKFRSSFEARNAGFQDLVIFGQHGVSSTVRNLLTGFGLSPDAIPTLALLSLADTRAVYSLPLPLGDGKIPENERLGALWEMVLEKVEAAADEGGAGVELAGIPGLAQHAIPEGSLARLANKLLAS